MHKVLVLGGYGFFGNRIAAALARNPRIDVLIAGRDADKAAAAARALGLPAASGKACDANDPALARRLAELRIGTVIHTAGPFQRQHYTVARAAIEAGCNYIDLADGRDFVCGIATLDEPARRRGVRVISGASSVPALSSAVVDRYRTQFARLDVIRLGIGTGARVPGVATVQSVFGYCGKPFTHWENGAWATTHGWHGLHRHRFPPPVGVRWMSHCDAPDLQLFPHRYPSVRTVSFHAGFANGLGHLTVWCLAGLVRLGVLPTITPFASSLNRVSRWMEPLLSDAGGMYVQLEGQGRDERPLRLTWNLLARRNHGPQIPCGAAIALAGKLASGCDVPAGAMPCMGLLTVKEYLEPLRELDVQEIVE